MSAVLQILIILAFMGLVITVAIVVLSHGKRQNAYGNIYSKYFNNKNVGYKKNVASQKHASC